MVVYTCITYLWIFCCLQIQFLHFVYNDSIGGANQFADASHAADQLKAIRPDLYDLLSTTLVDFNDIGTDFFSFHMVHRHPIIR